MVSDTLMLFNLSSTQLIDFGKKLQLATVASRSNTGYAGLFPKEGLFQNRPAHPFLKSHESKRENYACAVQ